MSKMHIDVGVGVRVCVHRKRRGLIRYIRKYTHTYTHIYIFISEEDHLDTCATIHTDIQISYACICVCI